MIKQSFSLLVVACLVLAAHGLGPAPRLRTDLGASVRSPALINDRIRDLRSAMLDESDAGLLYCTAVVACASLGQTCAHNGSIECIQERQCYSPDESAPTCVNRIPVGQNCSYFSGPECVADSNCDGSVCKYEPEFGPGDKCTQNTDCYNSLSTNINGPFGTCVSGRCYGIAHGGPCNNTQSAFNSGCLNGYCDAQTLQCTAYKKIGDTCTTSTQCPIACLNGVCASFDFSPVGGNCTDSGCVSGAYCGTDDVCHSAKDITNAACDSSADCTNGLRCECNSVTGLGVCSDPVFDYDTYYSAILNYLKCFESNNCNQLSFLDQCTACSSQYCGTINAGFTFNSNFATYLSPTCVADDQKANIRTQINQQLAAAGCPNSASSVLSEGVPTMLVFITAALLMSLF